MIINSKYKSNKKKVLILGGMGLIGFETAVSFLKNGSKVTILDKIIDVKKAKYLKKNFIKNIKLIKFEINQKNFLRISKTFFKDHDTFINCLYIDDKKFNKITIENLKEKDLVNSISYNIKFSMLLSLNFAKNLKKNNKKGSILNFGSIYSYVAQDSNLYKNTKIKENLGYTFFKAGLLNFNKQLCSSFSKYGIRSNIICPGGVRDKKNKLQNKQFLRNYSSRVPIGRMAKPSEIASVALFLSSDEASYITGASIIVDGGWTVI